MKISKAEHKHNMEAFRRMNPAEKVDYIFTYFKVELAIGAFILIVIISNIYGLITKRDKVLYTALVNVEINEDLEVRMRDDFLTSQELNVRKTMVEQYKGLYLTNDPSSEFFQYVYASRLKVLASIESHQLDVILMNREAYDTFSQSGYLLQLQDLFTVEEGLTTNMVIYEDNAEAVSMDDSIPYEAVTGDEENGLDCSGFAFYQEAGFTEPLYLGIVANTDRPEMAEAYIHYLMEFPEE